ncbi:ADP-ribosyl cyclase/cyclic ADP-ribose hydrolase isoform X1 [Hydra vulgaris]|uniref:ADP-ribosyl cyclase/cyclic ADP-ribose hydrolase isoform X1 n=1 Tax=Hydra vulgaris TaxID=6087 RepID=UPI001F5F1FE2|nr:ADP-ribosyl cyclase/cyclic ADP-ribose hydrolase-like isoform X1 [Hydra vulgaris]
MMKNFQICFLASLLKFSLTFSYVPRNFNGTTPNIKEIIIGRCNQFQQVSSQNKNPALFVNVDCQQFWSLFNSSFAFKDSCNYGEINESSYDLLFNLTKSDSLLKDQAMFWSGTRQIVHEYTYIKNSFFTLEDTFNGYVANDLNWCGCKTCPDGINYNNCMGCTKATDSFWARASRTFAENASGTAYVMVNGTTDKNYTAYYNGSYFGRIELPTLGKMKQITSLVILVINNLDTTPKELCGQGSLAKLVQDANKLGIFNINCIDDPRDTYFMQCAKYPNAQECQTTSSSLLNTISWKSFTVLFLAWSIILYFQIV